MGELDEKCERVMRLCHSAGLRGVLLGTQANFGWITGGRSNRIDGTAELGASVVFVAADGRRTVIANAIEMPRLLAEEFFDIPCDAVEYPWTEDYLPDIRIRLARRVVGDSDARIGADWPWRDTVLVANEIAELRACLTDAEVPRYRALGRDVAEAVGDVCRSIRRGVTEQDVERQVADATVAVGARPTVILIGADDRIARYRHPRPTSMRWQRLLLIVMCAQRDGLTVALSRLVSNGPVAPALQDRTRATVKVFERLLTQTKVGRAGRDLFAEAAKAYADVGFPGEERRHHQGGAIGYRSRDWIAHPACEARVQSRQAFAWNPSITGTKVEETALVVDGVAEIITSSPCWPSMSMEIGKRILPAPLVFAHD
jgi:Xaa-Pro dipeptidase